MVRAPDLRLSLALVGDRDAALVRRPDARRRKRRGRAPEAELRGGGSHHERSLPAGRRHHAAPRGRRRGSRGTPGLVRAERRHRRAPHARPALSVDARGAARPLAGAPAARKDLVREERRDPRGSRDLAEPRAARERASGRRRAARRKPRRKGEHRGSQLRRHLRSIRRARSLPRAG